MICVYIYIQQLSSCGFYRSDWLLLLAIFNTLFWVYAHFFHEKMDKTQKYLQSVIFVLYENGRQQLLGAQSTEKASLTWGELVMWLKLQFLEVGKVV